MKIQNRVVLKAAGTINQPVGSGVSLQYNGTVHVEVGPLPNTTNVYAKLHLEGDTQTAPQPGDDVPDGYVELDPGGGVFKKAIPVPTSGYSPRNEPPYDPNLTVTIIAKVNNDWTGDLSQALFCAVSTSFTVQVNGWRCPWFAFAPDVRVGPFNETPMSDYRPVKVPIPEHAQSAALMAGGFWGFAVGVTDGPAGSGDNVTPRTEYMDATYHSNHITGGPFPANKLVGLLETQGSENASIFAIGSGTNIAAADLAGKVALHLGHWDGFQWTKTPVSNWGLVSVNITWTPVG